MSGRCPGGGNDTTVFLPGKSHRRRSQAGYSPWGRKESCTAEHAGVLPCQNGIKLKGEDPSFPQYVQSLGVTGARQALKTRPRTQHCWRVYCVREWRQADPLRAPPRPAAQHGPLYLKYRDGDCSTRAQGTHHTHTHTHTHTHSHSHTQHSLRLLIHAALSTRLRLRAGTPGFSAHAGPGPSAPLRDCRAAANSRRSSSPPAAGWSNAAATSWPGRGELGASVALSCARL